MKDVKELIAERAKTHGNFTETAHCAQRLKDGMREDQASWCELSLVHRESLDNIQQKIARILTGDSDHRDAWQDIQGYCQLVLDRLPIKIGDMLDQDALDRLNAYLTRGGHPVST